MAWLDRRWRYRIPVSIPVPTGNANGNAHAAFNLPESDHLWSFVTSIDDVAVALPDATQLGHEQVGDSFNVTDRSGAVNFGNVPVSGAQGGVLLAWLYYAPEDGWTPDDPPAIGTGETSYLNAHCDVAEPSTYLHVMRPPGPRATSPRRPIGKNGVDEVFVWIDPTDLMERANTTQQERRLWEEPALAKVTIYDDSATDVTSSLTYEDRMRWVTYRDGRTERIALRVYVRASTANTAYTIVPSISTTVPRPAYTNFQHRKLSEAIGLRSLQLRET